METINSKLFLICAVIGFQCAAQIFLKIGVHKTYYQFLIPLNYWTMLGYVCIVLNFIFWMQYLKIEKLNVATAAISLVYIIIPLLSALILKESLSVKMFIGFIFIAGGVLLTQIGNT